MKDLLKGKKIIIIIVSLCLIVLFVIGSMIFFNKENKNTNISIMTKKYVALVKINPIVKLEYTQTCNETDTKNISDCDEPVVTQYELINDDAKNIYKDIDLLGSSKDLIKVINLICDTAKNNGVVFEKIDVYTDWDKIENYISEKKEVSNIVKYNVEITNLEEIDKIINVEDDQVITYNVSFDSNGGSSVSNQKVNKDDKVNKPNNPTRGGYTFIEWQLDNKTFDFNTKINKDITLIAKWKKIENNTNNSNNNENTNSNNNTTNTNNNTNNSNNTNTNTNNNNSNDSNSEENNNTIQQPTPSSEDLHKGIINLNDNVTYITGDIVYKCDNCISDDVIQKINSAKGITNRGLNSSYAWIISLNIPEGKYSNYSGGNLSTIENWLIECGADLVGGASDWDPKILTEQVCNEYKLSCDRW